jgi:hypothetical protein
MAMTKSNKEIVLEVLKRAFIDRDPTVSSSIISARVTTAQPGNCGWPLSNCEDHSDPYGANV